MSRTFKMAMYVIRLCAFLFLGSAIYQFAIDGQWEFATVCVSLFFAMVFVFTMLTEIYEKAVS